MDEIIEKLRQRTPEELKKLIAEPITARVSRERERTKLPVTPPALYYRSPQLTNKFYAKEPQ